METTINKLTEYETQFFNKLSNYLDTKLYFYGSIQRADYFPKSSDIDVDIFVENEKNAIQKIQHFLNIEKSKFRKIIYSLHKTNKVVYGYKVKYEDVTHNFTTELSIYNEKYKKDILLEHNYKTFLPSYITFLLYILKSLYYNLKILPTPFYNYIKKIIINVLVEGKDCEFVTIS
jgi:hypothetical protein